MCRLKYSKNLQPQSMRSIQDGNESRVEYLLDGVASEASGLYSCRAENVFGEAESSVRIDVDGRPFIREMTSPRRLLGGSLHEWLHCSYGGFPIDKVTWDKDGECFDTNIWPQKSFEIIWRPFCFVFFAVFLFVLIFAQSRSVQLGARQLKNVNKQN